MLQQHFEHFGTVLDSVVIKDSITRLSRCFGFVTFRDPESVSLALAHANHIIDGRRVDIKRSIPRSIMHEYESSQMKKTVRPVPYLGQANYGYEAYNNNNLMEYPIVSPANRNVPAFTNNAYEENGNVTNSFSIIVEELPISTNIGKCC